MNLGSRAHYIGAGDGDHCPLIEGIAPDQDMEGGLGPLWPSSLEINSNTPGVYFIKRRRTKYIITQLQ
jgi:hypothetical protein